MQILKINNFGPIRICEIEIRDFMVLTGEQASGKSTVAKSIFYFNHLKDELFDLVRKEIDNPLRFEKESLEECFCRRLRYIFYQSFGLEEDGAANASLLFQYENTYSIEIKMVQIEEGLSIQILLDENIKKKLKLLSERISGYTFDDLGSIRHYIDIEIFDCDRNIVYIPAGRSLLTLLSNQISYLYAVMDDMQKGAIDYCTKCYLEEVLKIKPFFKMNLSGIIKQLDNSVEYKIDTRMAEEAADLIKDILHGEYRNENGFERLYYTEKDSVRINFASSGQQEAVWITNILFYYMLGRRKSFFIIEEPESHLFPNAQKALVELISLVKNGRNQITITTHSPYILGSINNLLYAKHISGTVDSDKLVEIIKPYFWLDYSNLGAFYLREGRVDNIKDDELENLNHEYYVL